MARGWESKSIEDQQEAAAQRKAADIVAPVPPEVAARRQELDSLQLARTRVLADLQRACKPAHRSMLERALADVDVKIEALRAQ